jgi:hypothetical protein
VAIATLLNVMGKTKIEYEELNNDDKSQG